MFFICHSRRRWERALRKVPGSRRCCLWPVRGRRSEGRSLCEVRWPLSLQGLFRLVSSQRGSPGVRSEGRCPKGQSGGSTCHHTWPPRHRSKPARHSVGGTSEVGCSVGFGSWTERKGQAQPMQPALPVMRRKRRREAGALHLTGACSVTGGGVTGLCRFVPDSPHNTGPWGLGWESTAELWEEGARFLQRQFGRTLRGAPWKPVADVTHQSWH